MGPHNTDKLLAKPHSAYFKRQKKTGLVTRFGV
jgi:hypothetical protein